MDEPAYRRVIVKLSGEALTGSDNFGIHQPTIDRIAGDLVAAQALGIALGVLLGGGTGNPFFTTDTTAVLRAAELGCGAVLKATNVDGVYSADPKKEPAAKRYDRLSHEEAIAGDLRVMDATAFTLARENRMPIIVFSIREPGGIAAVLRGKGRATLVGG